MDFLLTLLWILGVIVIASLIAITSIVAVTIIAILIKGVVYAIREGNMEDTDDD